MDAGSTLHQFLFGIYPYVAMTVFFAGSLLRFDREQYTWKSDSSQLLRASQLRWGSNLFHFGVLFIFFGHLIGLLAPHWSYAWLISAGSKQLLAMISGGLAGAFAIVGLTLLIHRRVADPRIRSNTRGWDIAILVLLWLQLALGLSTVPLSARHLDGSMMLQLAEWVQRIATFRPGAAELVAGVPLVFKTHLLLGLTIFLVFPFTRLVHIWSGFAAAAYLLRPYQIVRTRRKWKPTGVQG
ncbi:MAG TPA: respiratory nitrate reductase subunit gamma [Burkholderiales bacterium]|nr:respiratory nitrate reductase subunit gamma [Burkholderiales bacterium]